ncbi:hypothetical protein AAVH_13766 [Aphelenchoides avenae]|nr:hypothetical protein AAVH_13766 [Aphelenchus avenae]
MLNGEYREKHELEVSVAADGMESDDFEAFLQCVYPTSCEQPDGRYLDSIALLADYYGISRLVRKCCQLLEPPGNFSKVQKLKVAVKLGNVSLEAAVMASLTKSDIQEIANSEELRGHLGEERVVKILKKLLTL